MRRTTIHISAALALLLGLAACNKYETPNTDGTLPAGKYPVIIQANGLDVTVTPASRAPVDGNWEGVQRVGVLIGTVKAYDVTPTTADNTRATLTSTDPHYWADHNDLRVTAWWPYTAGETAMPVVKVRQDQSTQNGYEGSDFIAAEEQAVSYANPTLRFTHRTARVTVALTDRPEESMNVRLTGLSTENENPAVITPYNKGGDTWSVLVAPQTVAAGTAFITCTFTSGKSFVYRMQKAAEWKAGEEYTYTVSLAAAEDPGYTIESDGSYTVNNEKGLKNIASLVNGGETDINITLDTDLDLTNMEWTPIGTYDNPYTGIFNGKDKTITGLTVTGSNDYAGLFGCIGSGGTVKDVTLTKASVTGGMYVGGVAGQNEGTVENCSVDGTVTGTEYNTGGIVGINYGTISGCKTEGTVTGDDANVGGIAGNGTANYDTGTGNFIGSTIEGCHSTAAVSGSSTVGGVVGNLGNGCSLMACYSTGNVTATITSGSANAGGVVGANSQGTVTGCYHATGTVSGQGNVGGIVGFNSSDTFTACYWSGSPGNDNGGTTTEVTDGDWNEAMTAMNIALQNASSVWRYKFSGELPTLE